jgi:Reverse transcriptase (RNA-dependent DNA polymerase)
MPHVSLPPQPPSLPVFPSNYHNFSLSNPLHSVPTMPNPLFVPAFPYLPVFPPVPQNTPAGLPPPTQNLPFNSLSPSNSSPSPSEFISGLSSSVNTNTVAHSPTNIPSSTQQRTPSFHQTPSPAPQVVPQATLSPPQDTFSPLQDSLSPPQASFSPQQDAFSPPQDIVQTQDSSQTPENPSPSANASSTLLLPSLTLTNTDSVPRLSTTLPDSSTNVSPSSPPAPHRSSRIAARLASHATALLAEFAPFRDSHVLIPLIADSSLPSVDVVLQALASGSATPVLSDNDDPSWLEALASPEREYWIASGREELKSLEDLNVFVLVPCTHVPRGQHVLKGKLVCKCKRDDAGNIIRYKVRYVAKGYAQQHGVDYDKVSAPTAQLESFRVLLHLAASLDWDVQQFDVKTAFLHGILPESETMFLEQPPGFAVDRKEDHVMKLMKSIYGMKQASRVWNATFNAAVEQWGFTQLPCEWCVYRHTTPSGTVLFAVHVDDIIAIASSPEENSRFHTQLRTKWEISALGPAKFALGISMTRHRPSRSIALCQTLMIDRVLDKFGQLDAHPANTPMAAGVVLERPDKSVPIPSSVTDWMARTPYRELVGSLMYIAIGTRPDIAYAVSRLSTFLDCYRPEHWGAAIRVLRYLKGTRSLSLVLGGNTPPCLGGFSDSDYASCTTSSRSISGYCYSLGSGVVSWSSRKQRTVADSSCYAEYIALHDASHEAIFLRQLLEGLGFAISNPTTIHCDNHAASIIAEDHVWGQVPSC